MSRYWNDRVHVSVNPLASIKNLKASKEAVTTFRSDVALPERINGAKEAVANLFEVLEKAEKLTDRNDLADAYSDCYYLYGELEIYIAMGIWDESWFAEDPKIFDQFEKIKKECGNLTEKLDALGAGYEPNDYLALRLKWIFEAYGVPNKYQFNLQRYYEETQKKAEKYLYQWLEKEFKIRTKTTKMLTIGLPVLSILAMIPVAFSHPVIAVVSALVLCVILGVAGYLIDDGINTSRRKKTVQDVKNLKKSRNRALALSFIEKLDFLQEKTKAMGDYPSVDADEYACWAACMATVEEYTGVKICTDDPGKGEVTEIEMVGFCNQGLNKFLWRKGVRDGDTMMYLVIDLLESLILCMEKGIAPDWLVVEEENEIPA